MQALAQPRPDYDDEGHLRSGGWVDRRVKGLQRRRHLSNGCSVKRRGRKWAAASHAPSAAPDDQEWPGAAAYTHAHLGGPLQMLLRDADDVGNRATYEIRLSHAPDSTLQFRALDTNVCDAVPTVANGVTTYTYGGIWRGCSLSLALAGRLKETITVDQTKGPPEYFEWTVKAPPGHTVEVVANSLRLIDPDGNLVLATLPPWGEDSATTGPTPSGRQYIRCTLTEAGRRNGLLVIRLEPNAEDMANAIGLVSIDPTIPITGAADVDDTLTYDLAGFQLYNYGGWVSTLSGRNNLGTGDTTSLHRLATSALPAGTVTRFQWDVYQTNSAFWQQVGGTASAYRIVAVNDWGQGSSVAATEVGACDYTYAKNATLAWAGGTNGCGAPADYLADASPPQLVFLNTTGPTVWQLPPSWVSDWKSGAVTNRGYVVLVFPTANGEVLDIGASDHPTPAWRPTWTIDYTAAAGGGAIFDLLKRRRFSHG